MRVCLGQCRLKLAMQVGHKLYHPVNVHIPQLMFANLRGFHMMLTNTCRQRMSYPRRWEHTTREACRPLLILMPSEEIVCHLCTFYAWFFQAMTYDALLMCTHNIFCMHALTDVSLDWQLSFSSYAHDTPDACKLWLMFSSDGWCV